MADAPIKSETPEEIAEAIIAKYGTPKSPAMLHAMLAFAVQMGKIEGAARCSRLISETFELARKRA